MRFSRKIISLFLALILLLPGLGLGASARGKIAGGIGFVITSQLRLYSKASNQSDVLDTAYCGDCVVILRQEKDWYRVIFNLQEGYMRSDCLDAGPQRNAELGYGRINGHEVSLRSGPGMRYSILEFSEKEDSFYIVGFQDGWYQVLKDNATCFVRSDLLDLTEIPYENKGSEHEPQFFRRSEAFAPLTYTETEPEIAVLSIGSGFTGPITGAAFLAQAQKCLGIPYVYGGASPDGFDCSGLVYYVLTQMGYPSARTASAQYGMGYNVDRSELQPGDLVFFEGTNGSGVTHVGIYSGGNQFLHAQKTGTTVGYGSLSGYWSDHFCGARRIA